MSESKHTFIISLDWIDALTIGSLLIACAGIWSALRGMLSLAIALMLLAMFTDMLDGMLARATRGGTEFGRYLDSFCDVFTYLLLPMLVLYQFGMQDTLSLIALFIYILAGILRLSHFNMHGIQNKGGKDYHVGLPVFWSQLLIVLAFPLWYWTAEKAKTILLSVLFIMSYFMITRNLFPKPVRYRFLTILILSVAASYFYLHFIEIRIP